MGEDSSTIEEEYRQMRLVISTVRIAVGQFEKRNALSLVFHL